MQRLMIIFAFIFLGIGNSWAQTETAPASPASDGPLTVAHFSYSASFEGAKRSSQWKVLESGGSIIGANQSVLDSLENLERIKSTQFPNETIMEFWRWHNGALRVFAIGNERFFTDVTPNSAAGMIERIESWPSLQQIGLKIEADTVQSKANRIGKYFYAVSDDNNAGLICIFHRQTLPIYLPPYYEAQHSDPLRGEVSSYECHVKQGYDLSEIESSLTERIVTFLEALHD